MKVLVVGLGSIGRRHWRLLGERRGVELFALRSGVGPALEGVQTLRSWAEVRDVKPDAALVTNPTSLHIRTARRCVELGMHVLIEKPLDKTLRGFAELERAARARKRTVYVAYNLRFHPGIQDLRRIVARRGFWHASVLTSSYLPDWRPGTDYTRSHTVSRRLGGGVLLELSHEVDYASYVFGPVERIAGVRGHVSDLAGDSDDAADFLLFLKGGRHVSVHLDFCSRNLERVIRVMTPGGFYRLDMIAGELHHDDGKRSTVKRYPTDRDLTYRAQLDYFFRHLGRPGIMNGLKEAGALLSRLLAFQDLRR